MKRIILLFACLLAYQKTVYGQTEFIDFVSIGAGYDILSTDNNFLAIILPDYLLVDYSIGSLFHKIDLATLVNVRTNTSELMVGGEVNYFGFNLFGFGISGGIGISNDRDIVGYYRGSVYFHLVSMMKMTVDIEYRSTGKWNMGILVSVPLVSNNVRGNNVQYSRMRTNKDIMGKWGEGDRMEGIVIEFKEDSSFEYIRYVNEEVEERRYGYFSTGNLFGSDRMRMVYTDRKRKEGYGVRYEKDNNKLRIEIEGEMKQLERKEE